MKAAVGEGFAKLKSDGSGLNCHMSADIVTIFRDGMVFTKSPVLIKMGLK
jgi:hypothetical protein